MLHFLQIGYYQLPITVTCSASALKTKHVANYWEDYQGLRLSLPVSLTRTAILKSLTQRYASRLQALYAY